MSSFSNVNLPVYACVLQPGAPPRRFTFFADSVARGFLPVMGAMLSAAFVLGGRSEEVRSHDTMTGTGTRTWCMQCGMVHAMWHGGEKP